MAFWPNGSWRRRVASRRRRGWGSMACWRWGVPHRRWSTCWNASDFGTGNAQPRFALSAVRILKADVVGQGHIRVIMGADDGSRLKGIAFRAADGPVGATLLQARGLPLHVAGGLRRDRWQGRDDVQMFIDDVASAAAGH